MKFEKLQKVQSSLKLCSYDVFILLYGAELNFPICIRWVPASQIIVSSNEGQRMSEISIGSPKDVLKGLHELVWVAIMIVSRIIFYAFVEVN